MNPCHAILPEYLRNVSSHVTIIGLLLAANILSVWIAQSVSIRAPLGIGPEWSRVPERTVIWSQSESLLCSEIVVSGRVATPNTRLNWRHAVATELTTVSFQAFCRMEERPLPKQVESRILSTNPSRTEIARYLWAGFPVRWCLLNVGYNNDCPRVLYISIVRLIQNVSIAYLFVLTGFLLLTHWRQCVRRQSNRCSACGYRLVGLNSTKCPECGHGIGRHQYDPGQAPLNNNPKKAGTARR